MYEGECPQGGRQYKEVVPTECRGRGDYQREFTILQQSVRPICPCFFSMIRYTPLRLNGDKALLSPGQTDAQVDASLQNQNLRTDLKGGQTDSQVGSRVAKSSTFHTYHWLVRFYNNRLLATNLCRLALGGQMVKKTCVQIRARPKSTQVDASRRPNETQVERESVWLRLYFLIYISCAPNSN